MANNRAFTIIELIITLLMTTILFGAIVFVYLTFFKVYNASQDRSQARNQLSQAIDVITKDLNNAQSITVCNATTLTFNANLGNPGDPANYTYNLSSNNLIGPTGAVKAAGIQPQGTNAAWGTVPALFTCTNGLVTIDMTAVSYGETVHLQTNVRTRNMPVGLVGWWRFNEATSGTCTGAAALDSSGNGNVGTCNNSPTWTTGNVSGVGAMSFNGSNQYVATGTKFPSITSVLTVAAWVNPGTSQMTYADIWGDHEDDEKGFVMQQDANNLNQYYWCYGHGSWACVGDFTLTANQWQNVVAVKDSQYCRVYINGVEQVSSRITCAADIIPATIINFSVGLGYAGGGRFLNGSVEDVRVYNRALSASEITQLYSEGV